MNSCCIDDIYWNGYLSLFVFISFLYMMVNFFSTSMPDIHKFICYYYIFFLFECFEINVLKTGLYLAKKCWNVCIKESNARKMHRDHLMREMCRKIIRKLLLRFEAIDWPVQARERERYIWKIEDAQTQLKHWRIFFFFYWWLFGQYHNIINIKQVFDCLAQKMKWRKEEKKTDLAYNSYPNVCIRFVLMIAISLLIFPWLFVCWLAMRSFSALKCTNKWSSLLLLLFQVIADYVCVCACNLYR